MSIFCQRIDFVIGLLGFIASILTLYTTIKVRKRIVRNAEYSDFHRNIGDIVDKLQAHVNSINDDKLRKPKFAVLISQDLVDIETRFTFLKKDTTNTIENTQKLLCKKELTDKNWNSIANNLITIKNNLLKEDSYYG